MGPLLTRFGFWNEVELIQHTTHKVASNISFSLQLLTLHVSVTEII